MKFNILHTAQALTCYCIGQYCSQPPSNPTHEDANYENSISDFKEYPNSSHNDSLSQLTSCEAKKGAKCFAAKTQVVDSYGTLMTER